jgi:hypothetical protein
MGGVGLGEMGMANGGQMDALQALIAGELPADRTLVGDGQKLTPGVIDLLLKVDGKLKVSATRSGFAVGVGVGDFVFGDTTGVILTHSHKLSVREAWW